MDRNRQHEIVKFSVSVALRKESVDRNILSVVAYSYYNRVALRKESVDRNNGDDGKIKQSNGRSPQGERG